MAEKQFGLRLRRAREVRGLSQADLAAKAELPASSISHFEAGSRKPSLENLRRLVVALEVSADFLLGRIDELGGSVDADPLCRDLMTLSEADRQVMRAYLQGLVRGREGEGAGLAPKGAVRAWSMHHHSSHHDWVPGEVLPVGFVKEIAECARANCGLPFAFAALCPADALIWMVWASELPPSPGSPWREAYDAVQEALRRGVD